MRGPASTATRVRTCTYGFVTSEFLLSISLLEPTSNYVGIRAARLAMALLKNGGSAVDAVEIAIKFFEDHEITNAGYGSNLTVKGSVECDATMVDHLGRSGAAGAVERPYTLYPGKYLKRSL